MKGSKKSEQQYFDDLYQEYLDTVTKQGKTADLNRSTLEATYKKIRKQRQEEVKAGERETVGNVKAETLQKAVYKTSYKTARAEYEQLKKLNGNLKFKDIRNMKTTEFADLYNAEITAEYHNLRNSGMSAADAKKAISRQWFNSK